MSYVYVLKCNTAYKIGVAKSVEDRIKNLQTGNSQQIEKVCSEYIGSTAHLVENKLHKMYSHCRLEGEWFALTENEVSTIKILLEVECKDMQNKATTDTAMYMFTLGTVLNQAEQAIVKFLTNSYTLKETVDGNTIEPSKCTLYDRYIAKALEKNYKNLYNQQVLVRIQRGKYLINPIILGITSSKAYYYYINKVTEKNKDT